MEDLIKNDASFELYHNSDGANLLNNRVLTTYPSEKSSFQVFLGLDGYSNFEDDKKDDATNKKDDTKDTTKTEYDPEKIAQSVTATAGAIGSVASTVQAFKGDTTTKQPSRRKQLIEVCGRKPLSKKKREAYNTCVADYNAGKRGAVVDNQTDDTPPTPTTPAPNNTKKIIIGLVVVGVIVGAYIGYKKGLFSAKATN